MSDLVSSCSGQTIFWIEGVVLRLVDWAIDQPVFVFLAAAGAALTGRAFGALIGEYSKLWWFKGIPPWRARDVLLSNIEGLEKSLRSHMSELEQDRDTINRVMERAEILETKYRVLQIENSGLKSEIEELRRRLGDR